jgi:hypothetical protein
MVTTLGDNSLTLSSLSFSQDACLGDTHPPWVSPFLSIFFLLSSFSLSLSLSLFWLAGDTLGVTLKGANENAG